MSPLGKFSVFSRHSVEEEEGVKWKELKARVMLVKKPACRVLSAAKMGGAFLAGAAI